MCYLVVADPHNYCRRIAAAATHSAVCSGIIGSTHTQILTLAAELGASKECSRVAGTI